MNRELIIAHSGEFSKSPTAAVPSYRFFETKVIGHSRAFDTEVKLLEQIAMRLQFTPNQKGVVRLYTILEPCKSCQSVIDQFKHMFPEVRLIVSHGQRISIKNKRE
ncbi:MAG: hypothetical protein GY820_46000 [Gammaproteobacteria bacterium]|nr:hypothetical protein [Gammaproteobacteria bacterium]